jgi:hypothetical protein
MSGKITPLQLKWWKKKFLKIRKLLSWIKFHWNAYDFDYAYFIDMMIKKLTYMGTSIYVDNIIVDRKKIMSSIWKARKQLQNFRDAFDKAEIESDKRMIKEFGQKLYLRFDMKDEDEVSSKLKLEYYTDNPVDEETKQKMIEYHTSMLNLEYELQQKYLGEFCKIMQSDIYGWWD